MGSSPLSPDLNPTEHFCENIWSLVEHCQILLESMPNFSLKLQNRSVLTRDLRLFDPTVNLKVVHDFIFFIILDTSGPRV